MQDIPTQVFLKLRGGIKLGDRVRVANPLPDFSRREPGGIVTYIDDHRSNTMEGDKRVKNIPGYLRDKFFRLNNVYTYYYYECELELDREQEK